VPEGGGASDQNQRSPDPVDQGRPERPAARPGGADLPGDRSPGGRRAMSGGEAPLVVIPEIRDYQRINAEVGRLLADGHGRVRLLGAEGHRLLLAGLRGAWEAVVEVEGRAGPELAADLDAPGLLVVCLGPAADGA